MKKHVISLYDFTTEAVKPWAKAGFDCFCYDIQHEETEQTEIFESGGSITKIKMDLQETEQKKGVIVGLKFKGSKADLEKAIAAGFAV